MEWASAGLAVQILSRDAGHNAEGNVLSVADADKAVLRPLEVASLRRIESLPTLARVYDNADADAPEQLAALVTVETRPVLCE